MKILIKLTILAHLCLLVFSCQSNLKQKLIEKKNDLNENQLTQQKDKNLFNFNNFDKSKNKSITIDEFSAQMAKLYNVLMIENKEILKAENCKKLFCKNLDKNKDKIISRDEFFKESFKQFSLSDKNKDFAVSEDEFKNLIIQGYAE